MRNPKKAELHDHMGLHVPLTQDDLTFCKECGMPISGTATGTIAYHSTDDAEIVKRIVSETRRYNKFTLDILRRTPEGAVFIGRNIRKTDSLRKKASQDPNCALQYANYVDGFPHRQTRSSAIKHPTAALLYAMNVDKQPRRDTWMAVIGYDVEKSKYLMHFGISEEELREQLSKADE